MYFLTSTFIHDKFIIPAETERFKTHLCYLKDNKSKQCALNVKEKKEKRRIKLNRIVLCKTVS